jgi:hypothetical protein
MSRRFPRTRDERSSIGDVHVDNAVNALNRTCFITAATMAEYRGTRESTLPMLFRDDTLDKLKQVRGMVEPSKHIATYQVDNATSLTIDFRDAMMPTIRPEMLFKQEDRIGPLLEYIAQVKAVHDQFEEVKAVLRWLNRNATPGAIRYYFPTIMKLCPRSPAFADLQKVPSRYSTPPGLGFWNQSLKNAATAVAGSLMLPSQAAPRPRGLMWLTFNCSDVHLSGDTKYTTDQMIYNL